MSTTDTASAPRTIGAYEIRTATPADLDGARSVMLDAFYHDLRTGYRPRWHWDVLDLEGTYLQEPRHTLVVAVTGGPDGEEVVGTSAVRATGPKSPPHPSWLAERYPDGTTAQLYRVYVRAAHRRRGLARALVTASVDFVAGAPGYERIYLHTDASVPGAEPFWRSLAGEVHDGRTDSQSASDAVHFEIPIPGRS